MLPFYSKLVGFFRETDMIIVCSPAVLDITIATKARFLTYHGKPN
jgi:hypothetical protein